MNAERRTLNAERFKAAAPLAGSALLVALVLAISFWTFGQIEEATALRKHTFMVLELANELLSTLREAETSQRGYLLTGDKDFLKPYLAAQDNIHSQLEELHRLTALTAAQERLDVLALLIDTKMADLATDLELFRMDDMTIVREKIRGTKGMPLMNSIQAEFRTFIRIEQASLERHDAEFQENMRLLFIYIFTLTMMAIVFAISFAWLIHKRAQQQLENQVNLETRHLLAIQKEMNNKLQQKNVELEEASRIKSEFLANMSHELRTPLNAIIGFSEVLKDGLMGEMTAEQRGYIDDIFQSGKHLLSLINDILDLSKVEAGAMTLELAPVLVSSLLVNSLSIIKEKAATRNIGLTMDCAEDLGSIQADARKVKQIVYNLLSNAIKFSSEGGLVTLHASRVTRAQVGRPCSPWPGGRSFPLAENEFEEFIRISVTDSGIGIPPEGLEQLFKPFSQIDGGLARKFEGTGLGLVMVKLLAELHGGSVAVESAVGKGACFTVWLPCRTPGEAAMDRNAAGAVELALLPAAAPVASGIEAPPMAGRTALVVEDNLRSAELIRVQLEAEGFKVILAASAAAALVIAEHQPLSLITLDVMLPDIDGWDFLGRIKTMPKLRRIPIVIISLVAERNKGFSLGAAAVMQKPISRQELHESLSDLGLLPLLPDRKTKILVADDDPRAVELTAGYMQDLAGAVLRAYGGREAISIAQREAPDLIILDLMMPEVSGFDVVVALKERPATARIPIIIVTAKKITADDIVRLDGDVTTIMEKTEFDRGHFIAEVRRAMAGRK